MEQTLSHDEAATQVASYSFHQVNRNTRQHVHSGVGWGSERWSHEYVCMYVHQVSNGRHREYNRMVTLMEVTLSLSLRKEACTTL